MTVESQEISIKKKLTNRQKEVLDFIRARMQQDNRPPTLREIADQFQISSTNAVRSILAALVKKNYIRRSPKLSRGIDLIHPQSPNLPHQNHENVVEIPILGRVAAGAPITAVENLEGTVVVDREFLSRQSNVFALRVRGDSMKNAGILEGDLVFARQQSTAEKGQVVIARLGDEATVKYFHPDDGRIRLEPANPSYGPIIVDEATPDFAILGRVIGVMRRYRN